MCTIYAKSQLHQLSDNDLCALFNKITTQLYQAPRHSRRQSAALSNLENVRREIARRRQRPRLPGL